MIWVFAFFTLSGFSFIVWGIIGIFRFLSENLKLEYPIQNKAIRVVLTVVDKLFQYRTTILMMSLAILAITFIFTELIRKLLYQLIFNGIHIGQSLSTAVTVILYAIFIIALTSVTVRKGFSINISQSAAKKDETVKEQIISNDVAAIVPAHNEEKTIAETIQHLRRVLPARNIYVGSDASTDRTIEIAKSFGVSIADIQPNRGKARVLDHVIKHFDLINRHKAVLIVDADTEIDKNYLHRALPLFDNPKIVAVAGHVFTNWQPHICPKWSMFFVAYRVRLYRVLQAMMRYGQTWKFTNVTTIVPGFASMYRTSVLPHINISAEGLCIEDFNMTFEIHHKRLGKVGYTPKAFAHCHDPTSFTDYIQQVKRWNLGFWQTLRLHGLWPSLFSFVLAIFLVEVVLYALLFLMLPALLIWFATHSFEPLIAPTLHLSVFTEISFTDVLIGVFLIDYFITILVTIVERKPLMLLYGLGFIILRYIDAVIVLLTLPIAFVVRSDGTWVSPKRA